MCGIVGFTGNRQAAPILLDGLSKLEYRGYDSAGLAVRDGENLAQVVKAKGRLSNLIEKTDGGKALKGTCGIGHTRWATHGEPSQTNAHPHVSGNCTRSGSGTVESEVVGVHNGIIENYTELKEKLLKHGYTFYSQTDTEVVIKLVDYYYKKYNLGPIDAIAKTMVRVRGSYALELMFRDYPGEIWVARKDSPMIIGIADGETYVASDVPAILKYTRNVYYIGNLEFGDRIASICSSHNVTVDYAFQDINDIPGTLPEGRTKPWGTGQAVLAAKKVLDTPFIVINADDYYGKEGFKAVHEYLVNGGKSCMAGFVLKNTLSDNGGVTRGICKMDDQNNLTEVVETKNIVKTATGAEADGVAVDVNSLVSMNMWGLTPEFLDVLEEGFKEFFEKEVPGNPQKAEYLIPIFIGELLEQGKMSVKVLKTNDTWYGMTYHEDVAAVKDSFKKMLENGVYKADLFSDL